MRARRRFDEHERIGQPWSISSDHPAAVNGTTRYPATVRSVKRGEAVLKGGVHSKKIGSHVTKGRWRGMPIYTLTLEERATCPRSCSHWLDCYGNKMHWSHRYRVDDALMRSLDIELYCLSQVYPNGFVVRLHVLGDFSSVEYFSRWHRWMHEYKNLHVFGYTAHTPDNALGHYNRYLRREFPARWWIRFSNPLGESAPEDIVAVTGEGYGPGYIVCPAQTGKTNCCGTCGLCWTTKKPIVFLPH